MARRLTSSDWDAVLGSSSLRRISDSKPYMMKPHLVYIFKKKQKAKRNEKVPKEQWTESSIKEE